MIVRVKRFTKAIGLPTLNAHDRVNQWLELMGDKVEVMEPVQYWQNERGTWEVATVTYRDLEAEERAARHEDWKDYQDTLRCAVDIPF